jgi:predicted secreted protein
VIRGVKAGDVAEGKYGRYRLDRELGRGATAFVVKAHDLESGKTVALKLMLPGTAPSAQATTRFLREAEAVQQLKSDHVVRILDTGRLEDETPFIVMEFLEGQDLGQYLRERGRLPVDEVVDFVIQASDALAEAHTAKMVHRDIKPRNLFLTKKEEVPHLKVVDFGSSKVSFATTGFPQTQSTDTVGTVAYMSPEQMESPDVDGRADIWSLGVVMYELLTGRRPFEAASMPNLVMAVKYEPHSPLSGFPVQLAAIVDLCLEKEPAKRIPNMATLASLLKPFAPARSRLCLEAVLGEAVLDGTALHVEGTALGTTSRRRRAVWRVAAVLVVAVAAAALVLARKPSSPGARRETDALPAAPSAVLITAGTTACMPETDEQLCAKLNVNCDPVETTDSCGSRRTPNCGACLAPVSCGGDERPNHCGYSGTFAITLGGAKDESPGAIEQTRDGGYVIAGTTQSYGAGGRDVWVIRLDPAGRVLWERSYGGPLDDSGYSVVETPDLGFIVGGATASFGAGDVDGWILKLDALGNIEWQRTYGGADGDSIRAVRTTHPNGYVAAGATRSFGAGDEDIWVMKLDPRGNVQWERTFGGDGVGPDGKYADSTWSIEQLSNNGYFIAGDAYLPLSAGHWDGWALKLRPEGEPLWERTLGGTGREHFMQGHQLPDESYIATGVTQSFGAGADDLWMVHLDRFGDMIWEFAYGGKGEDGGQSVQGTPDGGFLVGGYTESFSADRDGWLVKLDARGNIEWQRAYGGPGWDDIKRLARTHDGNFVALGSTTSFGAGGMDIWVLKLDAKGGMGDGCAPRIGARTLATRTQTHAIIASTNVAGSSAAQSTSTDARPRQGTFAPEPLCTAKR